MSFFSRATSQKKDDGGNQEIPAEILSAVKIMGDEGSPQSVLPPRPSAPANLPLGDPVASPSPFLKTPPVAAWPTPASVPSPSKPAPTPQAAATTGLPKPSASQTVPPQAAVPAFSQKEEKKMPVPPVAPPLKNLPQVKPASKKKGIIFLIIGIIVVLVAAGGGYYYWQNETAKKEAETNEAPAPVVPAVPQAPSGETGTIKTLPYALDKPNYLSLDTETAEVAGIKKSIDEVGLRLVEARVTDPIEFIITDKNNNPLAFSRFAFLLGLTLPEELLAQIDEAFSLYLSTESGRTVVGLRLTLRDAAIGSTLITKNEGSLPKQMSPLLYADLTAPLPATVTFTPSPERADVKIVRYHNFSVEPNISFDYTVSGKDWYIGTSKEMFRLLLEKSK